MVLGQLKRMVTNQTHSIRFENLNKLGSDILGCPVGELFEKSGVREGEIL